jgi:hypothetical protein
MATRKQRARKHARRVQHGLAARQARQEALASAPAVMSRDTLHEHMGAHGFEQDERGKWRRVLRPPSLPWRHDRKRGPVLRPKKKRRR